MFNFCFGFVAALMAGGVYAGYADSTSTSGNNLGQGQSSDGGSGYGYSGSFSGNTPPNFASPQFPQFDFSGFLGNYLESLNKYHQEFIKKGGGAFSYSYSYSSPTASSKAESSITFKRTNRLQSTAQSYGQPGGFSGGGFGGAFGSGSGGNAFGGSFGGPDGGGFSFSTPQRGGFAPTDGGSGGAAATASFGPGGVQQTASVYPENPNAPNVNTRFGGASSGGPGFHSVFTSSQSHTQDVNGKPQTVNTATTTVNDNGKVTTYTAKNP